MVEKIRLLCKERKTSVASLEKELGFGNGTIRRWDTATPSYERLSAVASALGVTPAYLRGEETKKQPPRGELSQTKREFLDFVDTLSEDQIKKLHQLGLLALER